MTISYKWLAAGAALALSQRAFAGEELFLESYQTDTLPKGAFEAEQTATYREGKAHGTYNLWQTRDELEYGVTDRWQIAGYVNAYSVHARNDNADASRVDFTSGGGDGDEVTGGGPATIGNYVRGSSTLPIPAANYRKTDFDSVSFETIYRPLDVYTDPLGLAGYLEITAGDRTQEIELKGLAQKNFLDDRLVLVANVNLEFERDSSARTGTADRETELEFTTGGSFRFVSNWRVGAEIRNIRGFNGHSIGSGDRSYSVVYFGPMVTYAGPRLFATLGYQRQLPWGEAFDHSAQVEQDSGLNYKEFEANFVRLRAGITFR